MAILTRSEEVEGDLNVSVGTTDFSITDAAPEYHTDSPEIIDFATRSADFEVTEEQADPETPPAPPVDLHHEDAPADEGHDSHDEGVLS